MKSTVIRALLIAMFVSLISFGYTASDSFAQQKDDKKTEMQKNPGEKPIKPKKTGKHHRKHHRKHHKKQHRKHGHKHGKKNKDKDMKK
jgi:hypothetical protein